MPPASTWTSRVAAALAFLAVSAALVAAASSTIPAANVCPDFIQFWTAASLMAGGHSPYDPSLQAAVQAGLGWTRTGEGLGVYDFLPYYYPPWLGFAALPLLPLGYPLAKMVWLVLDAEALVAAALLLKNVVRGFSAPLAILAVALFGFSIKAVAMGQVAPFVLLLLAAAWRLLDSRRDVAAGCVLALLTIKPQLTVFFVGALLVWSLRDGRPKVALSFAGALAILGAVSFLVVPNWLPEMLAATRVTPMPTAYYPGLGTTWYVVLSALGLQGLPLVAAWSAAALPLLFVLARTTLGERRELADIVALSLVVPFFVAPYARPYDFPVLMIPVLTLLGSRAGDFARTAAVAAIATIPGLHILYLTVDAAAPVVGVRRPEFTYFWIPALVAIAWLCCSGKGRTERAADTGTAT